MTGSRRARRSSWDEAEFSALFRSHYDAIYRHCYRIVGSAHEAEDLAQEAFMRLYRQRFDPGREHNVRGWLFKVSTNLAYNALRGARRRQDRESRAESRAGAPAPDPAEAALHSETRDAVRRTLATLPARQARILLLRNAGLSYREVAQALDIAPGSVGTLLSRAERAFARAYRDTYPNEEPGEQDGM